MVKSLSSAVLKLNCSISIPLVVSSSKGSGLSGFSNFLANEVLPTPPSPSINNFAS